MVQAKLLIFSLVALTYVHSARILGIFPLPWGSHYILGTKLLRGLAEAGHDVTMVSPYKYKHPPKNGSWTDILLDGEEGKFQMPDQSRLFNINEKTFVQMLRGYIDFLAAASNITMHHPNLRNLIESNTTFDVVIIEQLHNSCQHMLAHHFKCPLIILSSLGPNSFINPHVGCPTPVSTVPGIYFQAANPNEMTLQDRFWNLYYEAVTYYLIHTVMLPFNNKLLHEVFPGAPDIYDLYYNASLVFLISHSSFTKAVPLVPNMVEVGGYFIDTPQKLPQDLQGFLDGAKDGAIYFSLGSQLKSQLMPRDKKKMFLDVFRKLNQRVLWKFEDDLPEKSDNVLIRGWMPQQDILAHPNIKLFITHGGLLSSTEAIYHGVPMLVLPVFADQQMNANQVEENGYGLKLAFSDPNFSEKTLDNLVRELLYDHQYRDVAQTKSSLYHDRPMTPMQTVVYWVEYVIKHKGAPHLRVPGISLPWYTYFMVDVFGLILIGLMLVAILLLYILRVVCGILKRKIPKQNVKLKNN